ncbi:hypothetical protein [Mycolicibacterium diernhoferi]|uniref:Lipoprotein n=2 Tax=Mycolicibacterium TaxID=1866885 RepID=A0A1Q4HI91_9MYCO|nr:hypothetical protein [Mycolicibacterium diernhoferi]OJZ67213.1 hypothetical protein BRW64_08305 [Mycolicibacterium diernhoferi]OPE51566.1 hypothetical protein BV510_19360 [Mycolicibacterium diernhoferi]PEG52618.1 hypothetical protein CRI78_20785 [Mycolicibacterium diernhoferi]QYL23410.1 hypothetical protein K0O62_03500 [Mycolicibacterium diernhoferi]
MQLARKVASVLAVAALLAGCAGSDDQRGPWGAQQATIGESLSILGWNVSVSNLRFEGDRVLIDVDAAVADEGAEHAAPESLRFGLYGALAHPIEADAVGGCASATDLSLRPVTAADPQRLSGTACLGPLRDQSQVRGVYLYSPQDRIPQTTVAYAAAFPVGLAPTNPADTGLTLRSTSVDAFRADGSQLAPTALGDPQAFTGNGYMLLGLSIDGLAQRYEDDAVARGGPLMVLTAPTLPGAGLSHACSVYGSSLLVLPDAARDAVSIRASMCTQGEINAALLYPSVSVVGTRAALWTTGD